MVLAELYGITSHSVYGRGIGPGTRELCLL